MPQSESGPPPAMYLHIPITRLLLMSAVSLGLYEVYWIYKNWQYVKERDGLEIHPFWRAVFGIFFIYGIMDMIRNDEEMNNLVEANFSPGFLAAGWIALTVVSNLASRAENFTFSLIPYLLSYASVLFLVPVQAYVNRVNAMMQPRPAWARWSKGHIVCLIIGIIGWLLILLSALLPDVPA